MAYEDELRELYDLARRALSCQADLGYREIIFEQRAEHNETPVFAPSPGGVIATGEAAFMAMSGMPSDPDDQLPMLVDTLEGSEFENLDDHRAAICECTKCPLGHTRTKFVYGVGNSHAKIMFVGEAPGRDEDLQGEPFVGRAGKLLDNILAAMKLTRNDVYIGNILKCRPPQNRDPQPEEMKACMPYLKEQIRLIQPQFICALGRIAAHGLLNTTTPLGKLRGTWHRFEGIPLIVTYHPAALLRFSQYKRPTWEDMQMLMAEYERLNPSK